MIRRIQKGKGRKENLGLYYFLLVTLLTAMYLLPLVEAGVVLNATDYIGFNISAAEIARINSGGLVFAGSTWVNASNLNVSNQLCLGGSCRTTWPGGLSGSGTQNYVAKWTASDTIANSIIQDDGSTLTVGGNMNMNNNLILNIGNSGTDFTSGGGLTLASTLTLSTITQGSILFAGSGGVVSQDNSNLYWDDSANRLGIGTASPLSMLHLVTAGSSTVINASNGTVNTGLFIGTLSGNVAGASIGTNSNHSFRLFTNGTDRLTVDTSGNVGIGTTSPNYLLEIANNSKALNVSGVLYVNGTSGNVGIGTTSPVQKLDVVGTINATTSAYSPIYYDSSGTTYYLDPANSGTSLNIAGKATQSGTPSSGGDLVTVDYGNAHYSPGGWSCTVRTASCATNLCTATASCTGLEKVVTGGCDTSAICWYSNGVWVIPLGSPVAQGWTCHSFCNYATIPTVTAYANCCT